MAEIKVSLKDLCQSTLDDIAEALKNAYLEGADDNNGYYGDTSDEAIGINFNLSDTSDEAIGINFNLSDTKKLIDKLNGD